MNATIKKLIWVYLVLLLLEGAVRKWLLPALADPLLIIRDPVVLVIYALALYSGRFPSSRFIMIAGVLAVLSVLGSVLGGHTNFLIITYGLRINYLHLPLIWVMARELNRTDVERMGAFLLLTGIPMAAVMVEQFRSPMTSFINRGVGGAEIGQLFGADDRIRPPGLFSFITGPQLFLPLCMAFFFDELSHTKRLHWYLLVLAGIALAVSLPVSISRTAVLATGVVAMTFLLSLPFSSSRLPGIMRPLILMGLLTTVLFQMPVFQEGRTVFMLRWDTAAALGEGGAWAGVLDRTVRGFTNPSHYVSIAPTLGHGIGMGSNVGARLASGEVGFLLAEEEWGKIILELGPVLGLAFVIFRFSLTVWLGLMAWRGLRNRRDALPMLIFAAIALNVLWGQWGPPTVLGFAVFGAGLLLAALNRAPDRAQEPDESSGSETPGTGGIPEVAPLPAPSPRRLPNIPRPTRP